MIKCDFDFNFPALCMLCMRQYHRLIPCLKVVGTVIEVIQKNTCVTCTIKIIKGNQHDIEELARTITLQTNAMLHFTSDLQIQSQVSDILVLLKFSGFVYNSLNALLWVGKYYFSNKQYEQSIRYLNKAFDLNPKEKDVLFYLGNCLIYVNKIEPGLFLLHEAIDNGHSTAWKAIVDFQEHLLLSLE